MYLVIQIKYAFKIGIWDTLKWHHGRCLNAAHSQFQVFQCLHLLKMQLICAYWRRYLLLSLRSRRTSVFCGILLKEEHYLILKRLRKYNECSLTGISEWSWASQLHSEKMYLYLMTDWKFGALIYCSDSLYIWVWWVLMEYKIHPVKEIHKRLIVVEWHTSLPRTPAWSVAGLVSHQHRSHPILWWGSFKSLSGMSSLCTHSTLALSARITKKALNY